MTTFTKGQRVQLKSNPRAHGTVADIDAVGAVKALFDYNSHGWFSSSDLEHVQFPVGAKVVCLGHGVCEVKEELGDLRFVLSPYGKIYPFHIRELRAAEEEKWVPKEGERVYFVSPIIDDIGGQMVIECIYRERELRQSYENGNVFKTREGAENLSSAIDEANRDILSMLSRKPTKTIWPHPKSAPERGSASAGR